MNQRHPIPTLPTPSRFTCLLACMCLLMACREQRPEPRYERVERPSQVEQANQAENASPATPGGAGAGGSPGEGRQGTGQYLPPSEQGAEVEITETPADGSQPPAAQTPSAAQASGSDEQQAESAGDSSAGTGGAVPTEGARADSAAKPPGGSPPTHQGAPQQTPAATVQGGEALSTTAAQTREEEARALEAELQRKLQQFDAQMRKSEQDAAAARAGIIGAGSRDSEALEGSGGLLERPPTGTGAGGRAGQATGLGSTPDLSGETSGHPSPAAGAPSIAPVDTADDDIVARQLREAAEREPDPVLKEKLWQEYRNYKGAL